MAGKEPDMQTNLPLFKVGRSGRVAIEGEDDAQNKDAVAFKRLMAKMQEEARPVGYIFGKGALDHDDIQYLKEQHQAEEDALRLRDQNERRAFAAFKAAASASDLATTAGAGAPGATAPATSPRLKVEPKAKSGIRQSSLLQSIVAVQPKKQRRDPTRSSSQSSAGLSRTGSEGKEPPRSGSGGKEVESSNSGGAKELPRSISGGSERRAERAERAGPEVRELGGGAAEGQRARANAGEPTQGTGDAEGGPRAHAGTREGVRQEGAVPKGGAPGCGAPAGAQQGRGGKGSAAEGTPGLGGVGTQGVSLLGLAYGDSDEDEE